MSWVPRAVPVATAAAAAGSAAVPLLLTGSLPADAVVPGVVVTYAAVGLLILVLRPRNRVGGVLVGGAAVWGIGEAALALAVHGLVTDPGSVPAADWLGLAGTLLRGLGWLALVILVPVVFADGRPPPGPWRWAVPTTGAAFLAYVATSLLMPRLPEERLAEVRNPLGVPTEAGPLAEGLGILALLLVLVALVGAIGGLVARWRAGGPLVRQQLLWFTLAAAVPVALLPLVATGLADAVLFGLAVLPVPVAIGVALLQHRLYDVHPAVNRTLAWGALSAALALLYVLVVGGVGALLQARGADWLPWLATGLVAIAVAALRAALQRAANRLTYGQWAQPEAVLAGVRRRVADAGDVHALLRDLVRELREGLGLAGIAVLDGDGRTLARSGEHSSAGPSTDLVAYGRVVGELRWSAPRQPLRGGDLRLLADIAGQLGTLVHAATLVTGLRRATERLVLAREDERRRLRRDLHDGVGSALAGLTFQAEAIRNLLHEDPAAAEAAVSRLCGGIRRTVGDVRRVVDGLRPPSLDELGLAGSLADLGDRLGREAPIVVHVDVAADLPALPAAVEVAAYRVAQEALTNVVRHARAARCRLSLDHDGCDLVLEVSDDGAGTATPRPGGTGLHGMAERAAELGGTLLVDGRPGRGSLVVLRLPTAAIQTAATQTAATQTAATQTGPRPSLRATSA